MKQDEFFPTYYDLESVVDNQITPMLQTLHNICLEYNIPMLASFQYKNSEHDVMICSTAVIPETRACMKFKLAAKLLTN